MGDRALKAETLIEKIRLDVRMTHREPIRSARRTLLGHYDEACSAWLRQIRKMWGKNALGIAQVYEDIAELRSRQGRVLEARQALLRAARAWHRGRMSMGPSLRKVSGGIVLDDVRRQEAWCLLKLGRVDEARRLFRLVQSGRNVASFEDDFRLLSERYPGLV